VRARALAPLALFALLASAAGSCTPKADPLEADCEPFVSRFCRCADGVTQGSQACERGGRSYTECAPCFGGDPQSGPGPASTPVCGNGSLDRGEDCDDGNTNDGDGCPADCRRRPPTSGESCEGLAAAALAAGGEFSSRQSLAGAAGDARGSCGGEGPELVFAFAPRAPGTLEVTMTPEDGALDAVLYVRRGTCADEGAEPAGGCQDDLDDGVAEALSLEVEAGTTYFVFADAQGDGGEFTLRARLGPLPGGCGDEGQGCATGLGDECASGTLRCQEDGTLACVADASSAEEICGDGADNDCDGVVDDGCPCVHSRCDEGTPLDPTCLGQSGAPDGCVQAICDADPFCCDATSDPPGSWDGLCVAAVRDVCGLLICPASAGFCQHTVCEEGDPLDNNCDGFGACVGKVCLADPYCCANAWDAQCVDQAATRCATTGVEACG
jgi:cysteine-rich repeat protein